jgi:hypothetical protein
MGIDIKDLVLKKEEDKYSTTDFYTTALLIARGFEVKDISSEGDYSKTKRFHFDKTPEVQEAVMSYLNGRLEGNIRDFRNAIETVKDMVWSSN